MTPDQRRPRRVPWPPFLLICGLFAIAMGAALLWAPDGWIGTAVVLGVFVAFGAALVSLGRRTQR